MSLPQLYLVVPCYNEEVILKNSVEQMRAILEQMEKERLIAPASKILLVDDGSTDRTWPLICELYRALPERIKAIRFAANRGHQTALFAGLMKARESADLVISLDADLQDDISVLPEFIQKAQGGCDIVYGVRSDRSSDSVAKRGFAELFYFIMRKIGVNTISNHADFRLMTKRALAALAEYGEVNLFLRGMIVQLGFDFAYVYYARKEADRPTHYSIRKMFCLAWDGVSSFSVYPIRMISILGIFSLLVSIGILGYILFSKFFGFTVPGWTFLAVLLVFFGGLQTLSTGIIGEYIAKTYLESKHRPKYFIRDELS